MATDSQSASTFRYNNPYGREQPYSSGIIAQAPTMGGRGPAGPTGPEGAQGVGAQLPEVGGSPATAAVAAANLPGFTTRFSSTLASIAQPLPAATAAGVGFRVGWSKTTDVNTLQLQAASGDYIGATGTTTFTFSAVGQVVEFQPVDGGWLPISSYSNLAGVAFAVYTTALRPAATSVAAGTPIFDLTLKKPLWSTGTAWVDATGANA